MTSLPTPDGSISDIFRDLEKKMNETIYEIFEKYFKDFNRNDLKDCDLNNNGNISISTHIYKIVISNQIQNRCIRIYNN